MSTTVAEPESDAPVVGVHRVRSQRIGFSSRAVLLSAAMLR
jgi:hypothetical protein